MLATKTCQLALAANAAATNTVPSAGPSISTVPPSTMAAK
jgi:hypothetical protein